MFESASVVSPSTGRPGFEATALLWQYKRAQGHRKYSTWYAANRTMVVPDDTSTVMAQPAPWGNGPVALLIPHRGVMFARRGRVAGHVSRLSK
jgi:hypothetical protein